MACTGVTLPLREGRNLRAQRANFGEGPASVPAAPSPKNLRAARYAFSTHPRAEGRNSKKLRPVNSLMIREFEGRCDLPDISLLAGSDPPKKNSRPFPDDQGRTGKIFRDEALPRLARRRRVGQHVLHLGRELLEAERLGQEVQL